MEVNFNKFSVKIKKELKTTSGFDNEKFWPVFMVSLALLLMVSFGPDLIEFAQAATGSVALNVTIASTLTFNMDATTKAFAALTPGTPVQATSLLWITTNNAIGHNTTIARASTTATLSSGAQTISDNPSGNNWTAPAATSTAGPSAVWTSGTTKGLGFRLKQTGTAVNTYSTVWWGTSDADANAKYSGIATSSLDQKIVDTTLGSGSDEKTVVEYKVDVIESQKSGAYTSSPVTYTALAN